MKAVCLLLCLGLARHISGHIFNRQRVPELERFKQYPPQVRYPQERYPQELQYQQEWYPQEDQYLHGRYPQEVNYQQKAAQSRLAKEPTKQLVQTRYTDSKSSETSEENIMKINQDSIMLPMYADPGTPPITSMLSDNVKELHGDAIEWRGIKIAVGPNSHVTKKEDIAKIFRDAQKATKHMSEEMRTNYHEKFENVPMDEVEDAHLNATQLSKKYQYPLEEHIVTTDDGYQLTLFRIQKWMNRNSREVTPKPVVFLMHGLQGSADDFMLMGPQSLAYLLADEGYDVWLGNARGNKYSRLHASKHPAQPDFWMYSNDEIALHDLPAMIDYALMTSGQQKLYYVGYSQGTTNYFALASTLPEYNQKVVKMYALSPMAYMTNVRSPLIRMIAPNSKLYEVLNQRLGKGEFKPSKELLSTMGGQMCEKEIGCKKVCSNVNFVMAGMNMENMDVAQTKIVMGHLPAGGSTRQIKQYGQWIAANDFRMYDHGTELNEKVYGDILPPKYEVKKITAPVALFYSEDDWLAHPKDVLRLKSELPNVTDLYEVPVEHFSHMDYMFSKKAPETVYKKLIESIKDVNKY